MTIFLVLLWLIPTALCLDLLYVDLKGESASLFSIMGCIAVSICPMFNWFAVLTIFVGMDNRAKNLYKQHSIFKFLLKEIKL